MKTERQEAAAIKGNGGSQGVPRWVEVMRHAMDRVALETADNGQCGDHTNRRSVREHSKFGY